MLTPVQRTLDAGHFNAVANDARVRPALGGEGVLDLTALISDPANVALAAEHGGFVLLKQELGVYEAHSLFLPEGRGLAAADAMRAGLRYMFTQTDAVEITTKVPHDNKSALGLARTAGFDRRFSRDRCWPVPGGPVGVDYYALPITKWAQRDDACKEAGETFHAQLEASKTRCGSVLVTHDEDPAHDHAAGGAMLMALSGQARKAVWFYNAWARFADYATIDLLSEQPVLIDVRDAVVTTSNGSMQVLSCR